MIRCVVFDFGKVLATGDGIYSEPAKLLGVRPEDFEAHYWTDRRAYDEGAPEKDYWGPILAKLGKPTAPETIRQLAALDAALWAVIRPEALQLVRDVRETGRLAAIVSNAPFALDTAFFDAPYAEDADYWFVSAAMGVAKPNRAVYYRVTEVLDVEPSEIAFIDDRQANIDAATEFGWVAHLWQSDADTRAWLVGLGALKG